MARWTKEEVEKLKELLKSGKTAKECKSFLAHSSSSIWAKAYELDLVTRRENKAREKINKLKKCHAEGYSCEETAKILGLAVDTVYKLRKKYGLNKSWGKNGKPAKLKFESKVKARFNISDEEWAKMKQRDIDQLCFRCPVSNCDDCLCHRGEGH